MVIPKPAHLSMPTCEMPPTLPLFGAKLNIYFQTPNNYEENYRISQRFQPLQAPHRRIHRLMAHCFALCRHLCRRRSSHLPRTQRPTLRQQVRPHRLAFHRCRWRLSSSNMAHNLILVLVFSQLEDFRTFYTAALTYIQQTIADGWKLKDAFKMEDYAV